MAKNKLLSGRVKVTPAANVTADRYDFLGLEQAEPNLGVASQDGYVLIYDSNAPGKRNWSSSSLLSGGLTAQSAFESANSASSYANSAFIVSNSAAVYANSAFISANAASSYANSAFVTANSASNYANASFETANSAGVYANAAFDKANSANILAQAAFNTANLKFNSSGGTISGDVTVTGNLVVEGNTVIVNVSTLAVEDSLIQLARNNTSDAVDIGFLGHYDAGSGNVHAGLIRRASDDTFYLFDNLTTEPLTNVIDVANSSIATLRANLISTNVLIRGYDPINHANAAFNAANNAVDTWVRDAANSASSYANGAFVAANTADQKAVTSGSYANSAYLHANAAFNAANNAVDTWVRDAANSASSYANGAFTKANTANTLAQAAYDAANNATDTWVRQAANSASSYANSSYLHANAAFNAANNATDTWVRNAANSASSYANSGYIHANAAFDKANSGYNLINGAFGVSVTLDSFTGDASCTTFTLSTTPSGENYTLITLNGITQHKSAYSVSGANVVFSEAPNTNVAIDVVTFTSSAVQKVGVSITVDTFTGDNSCTTFALSTTPSNENYTTVTIDGLTQQKSAYNVSGSSVLFTEAPGTNTKIEVTTFQSADEYAANTLSQLAFDKANSANILAQAAFNAANNATDTWVRNAANAASSYANSAFGVANSASSYANGAFAAANTSDQKAVSAGSYANSAYALANVKYDATGGTISGDVIVSGNLTVSGQTTYANSTVVNLGDSIITLNADIPQAFAPSENAGIEVDRGSSANVQLIWNETTDKWTFTNDGSAYSDIGSSAAESYANSAFAAANTADQRAVTSGTYANAAFGVANSASSYANGAFVAANTADQRAVTSGTYANAAFAAANTADQRAVTSGTYANSAYSAANSNYTSAVTRLTVTNSGASAYLIDQYSGNNPSIYVSAGETIAFLLNGISGHPFMIRVSSGGSNYDTGLTHVSTAGVVSTGSSAQGKESGTLYWKVPFDIVGSTYVYQCSNHSGMVGSIVIQQPASFVASNTALAFTAANTADQRAVTSGSYANSAYLHANASFNATNAASSYANSAFDVANSASSYANSAYTQANTATTLAQAAFNQANTGGGAGTDSYARNTANAASSYANSAYLHANAAFNVANSGGGATADTYARNHANSSYLHANAAFNAANSGGGSVTAFTTVVDRFTGDGVVNTFTLSTTPSNENHTFVYLNGVYQQKNVYNIAGSNIVFTGIATSNDTIEVVTVAGKGSDTSEIYISSLQNFSSNGQNTVFTLDSTPTSANQLFVYVDGVYQQASAYTLSGNTLTLSEALDANSTLEVRVFSNTTPSHVHVTVDEFTGTGACTTFTLSTVPTSKNLTSVIVGGVPQLKSAYSITGTSITFTGAPANGASIEVSTYKGGGSHATSFTSVVDNFAGNGSANTFTLSTTPQNENHTFVYLNGVYQNKSTYNISGANVVFTGIATSNDTIEVVTVAGSEMNVNSSRYNSRVYTGTGACTQFTISSSHSANSILVFENGICQEPISDYTVSGTTLTFTTAPANGVKIQIRELPV